MSQAEDKGQQTCVAPGEVSSQYKKVTFDGENVHWNNLLGHVTESPQLEVFKAPLDETISSEFPFPGELGLDGPCRSFQPGLFCGSAIAGAATALGALGDVMQRVEVAVGVENGTGQALSWHFRGQGSLVLHSSGVGRMGRNQVDPWHKSTLVSPAQFVVMGKA